MERPQPKTETAAERIAANKALRKFVEKKLKKHGLEDFSTKGLKVLDCPVNFRDGRIGHLFWHVGEDGTVFEGINKVIVKVFKTDNPTGPCADYISDILGEFIREDIDPSASGYTFEGVTDETVEASGKDVAANLFTTALAAIKEKRRDVAQGVDGHPITAGEAREVRILVAGSSVHRV